MTTCPPMFTLYRLSARVPAIIGGTLGSAVLEAKSVTEALMFHPHLTSDERCEYETVLAPNIYYYMFNSRKRGTIKVEPEDDDEDTLIPGYKGPTRVTATYLWQKENEEKVKGLLEEYFTKNPNVKRNAGQRNAAIQKLYKSEVPMADQARYKAMVNEENQNIKAGIRLDGEPLIRYVKRLPGTLQKALNNAHAIGGAHIMLTMVLESPDKPGNFEIHALNTEDMKAFQKEKLNTEDMKAFQKEKCVMKSMTAMREFVRQSHGERTGGLCGPPSPEVYPNRRGAWEPLLPNPEGLRAFELLSLNRGFWKLLWTYMGGDCRFPWAEIAKKPHLWLGGGPEELPGPLGDPSSLGGPINKAWVGFFYGHQTGTDLSSEMIFLRRVLAANPIDPSESEESASEGQHAMEWCQTLTQKLRESEVILRESSPQRLRIAPPTSNTSGMRVLEHSSDETTPLQPSAGILPPVAVPKPTSAIKPAKRTRAQKSPSNKKVARKKPSGRKGLRKKSKRSRQNPSESESEAEYTNEDSDEQNYEEEDSTGSDTSEDGELAGFASDDSSLPAYDGIRPPSPPTPSLQEGSPAVDDATSLFHKYSRTREGSTGRNQVYRKKGQGVRATNSGFGSDAAIAAVAAIGQPTTREEGKSPNATGLDESVNGHPKAAGPTDATMSEPEPDLPCRFTSSSPTPVSSALPIKVPKAKTSKGRVTKMVLPPEISSEARQTRSGAKRKAEEEATKVQRQTRSKK
ncbi:hypothetical protein RSAG8_07664, partial [Rhizoctonia solani AG-8 WAC10335]